MNNVNLLFAREGVKELVGKLKKGSRVLKEAAKKFKLISSWQCQKWHKALTTPAPPPSLMTVGYFLVSK